MPAEPTAIRWVVAGKDDKHRVEIERYPAGFLVAPSILSGGDPRFMCPTLAAAATVADGLVDRLAEVDAARQATKRAREAESAAVNALETWQPDPTLLVHDVRAGDTQAR